MRLIDADEYKEKLYAMMSRWYGRAFRKEDACGQTG